MSVRSSFEVSLNTSGLLAKGVVNDEFSAAQYGSPKGDLIVTMSGKR